MRMHPGAHFKFLFGFLLSVVLISGCQTPPTKVNENPQRNLKQASGAAAPVVVTEKTVVLDARPAFEYSLAHIPRAIPVQWTDFTQTDVTARGVLLADRSNLAKRLARIGITQDSEIVVVGNGVNGNGEEGRVAWTLAYLGLTNVRPVPMAYFNGALTNATATPPQPTNIWEPKVRESLLATKEEVLFVLNRQGVHAPVEFTKGQGAKLYRIIDVRTAREYLNKEGLGLQLPIPNMEAVNTPWTEFFSADGRPNSAVTESLRAVGITADKRIIVLDDRGLRSAAVTMALHELGFRDVANYAGGLQELLTNQLKSPSKKTAPKRRGR